MAGCLLAVTFTGRKAGSTSLAAEQTETESAVGEQEENISVSEKEAEPLEEPLTEGSAESEQSEDLPYEAESYEKSISLTLGEKEYQLLCEGHTMQDGLYNIEYIRLADSENSDSYVDVISTAEVSGTYWHGAGTDSFPVCSTEKDGNILIADLNFDGWNDLCFQGWNTGDGNIPYYCMLWNPQAQEFEYSAMLYNVETDVKNQWLSCKNTDGEQYSVTYYRYDAADELHMLRYVEKDLSENAVFEQLDLTYVEDDGMYTLPAVVAKDRLTLIMIEMAKQALTELYQWTGDKIETVCFQVNNLGGVSFALSAEDMEHSRIFFTRYFGADTEYNLSGYDKMISSIGAASGRRVWFSPMLFRVQPENMDAMTNEEIVIWYFERIPSAGGSKVKSIEQRYEDMWTIQTEAGGWFEVIYNAELKEVSEVTGPYPDYPVH
ncbi:MAG: hypothetical protein K2K54_12695 [Lachnospiraceae bacterium]|nr:hypothetical protein [Lachnospiraceae bacterium]